MQRTIPKAKQVDGRLRPVPSEAPKRDDCFTLQLLLTRGFSGAQSYSTMNRDRYYPALKEGVSLERLLAFCSTFLKGSPVPDGRDVVAHSRILLPMFRAAENAGLILLNHVQADRQFMPELR
ncbi:MAG: hypothetical protein AB1295_04280 [Candidatus Micrarchaeota archaeon]